MFRPLFIFLFSVCCIQGIFSQSLVPVWFNTINGDGYDYPSQTAFVDAEGAVYTGCVFMHGTLLGQENDNKHWSLLLLKYTPEGEIDWIKNYPATHHSYLTCVRENEAGDLVFAIASLEAGNKSFQPVQYGAYSSTDFGMVYLTLDKAGTEKGLIQMPRPVWYADNFFLRGDTLFTAYSRIVEGCDDPYKWNESGSFDCKGMQVRALNIKTGAVYWESEIGEGSMFQTLELTDIQGDHLLLTGQYYNGDLTWGTSIFPDEWRNNGLIAVMDARNGKLLEGSCFRGDDLEVLTEAVFNKEGKIFAGGMLTGTEMKGEDFVYQKQSPARDALFLQMDPKGKVEQYTAGWGDHFSEIRGIKRTGTGDFWTIGGFTHSKFTFGDTVLANSHSGSKKFMDGFLMEVNPEGKVQETYILHGTDRVEVQNIEVQGKYVWLSGYYEGSMNYGPFAAPKAQRTDGFLLLFRSIDPELAVIKEIDIEDEIIQKIPFGQPSIPLAATGEAPPFNMTLFPVPVRAQLSVEISGQLSGELHYQVNNAQGGILEKGTRPATNFYLDVSAWSAGVYHLTVWQKGRLKSRAFVKQ